jgi:hypothetical protein
MHPETLVRNSPREFMPQNAATVCTAANRLISTYSRTRTRILGHAQYWTNEDDCWATTSPIHHFQNSNTTYKWNSPLEVLRNCDSSLTDHRYLTRENRVIVTLEQHHGRENMTITIALHA